MQLNHSNSDLISNKQQQQQKGSTYIQKQKQTQIHTHTNLQKASMQKQDVKFVAADGYQGYHRLHRTGNARAQF